MNCLMRHLSRLLAIYIYIYIHTAYSELKFTVQRAKDNYLVKHVFTTLSCLTYINLHFHPGSEIV